MAVDKNKLQPTGKEAAQPENPDAALMIGGPGQEPPPEAPPEPELTEVTIGGRKFKVDSTLAQSLEQREQDFNRKFNEHDRELGDLRKFKQSYTPPEKPDGAEPKSYGTLLFEDPDAAVKRIQDEVIQKVTGLYVQDKSQSKFWEDFYRANKDIDRGEDDFIVRAVLQENYDELAPMKPAQAIEQLADLTRRQILRFSQKAKLKDDDNNDEPADRTRVEGASRSAPRAAPKEPQGPSSLTEAINSRRKARASARRPAA